MYGILVLTVKSIGLVLAGTLMLMVLGGMIASTLEGIRGDKDE